MMIACKAVQTTGGADQMHSLGRSIALLLLAMPLPAVAAPFCVQIAGFAAAMHLLRCRVLQQARHATAALFAR